MGLYFMLGVGCVGILLYIVFRRPRVETKPSDLSQAETLSVLRAMAQEDTPPRLQGTIYGHYDQNTCQARELTREEIRDL